MKRFLYILAALMTTALIATACGDPDDDENTPSSTPVTPQTITEGNHDEMPS